MLELLGEQQQSYQIPARVEKPPVQALSCPATCNVQRGLHNALPQRGGRNVENAQGIYPKRPPQRRNVGLGSSQRWKGALAQFPFGILNCVHKGMTGDLQG